MALSANQEDLNRFVTQDRIENARKILQARYKAPAPQGPSFPLNEQNQLLSRMPRPKPVAKQPAARRTQPTPPVDLDAFPIATDDYSPTAQALTPIDLPWPEREREEKESFDLMGRLKSAGTGVARGAVGATGTMINAASKFYRTDIGRAISVFNNPGNLPYILTGKTMPMDYVNMAFEPTARKAGEAVEGFAEEELAGDPRYRDEFFAGQVPEALGSTVPFIAGMLATGGTGAPALIAGGGMGMLLGSEEFARDAEASGATPEQVEMARTIGTLVGASEIVPLARLLDRLKVKGVARKLLLNMAKQAGEEGFQEGGMQLAQNAVAKAVGYDSERPLFSNVTTAALVGATVGAGMAGAGGGGAAILDRLGGRRQDGQQQAQEPATEPQQAPRDIEAEPVEERRTLTQISPDGEVIEEGGKPVEPDPQQFTDALLTAGRQAFTRETAPEAPQAVEGLDPEALRQSLPETKPQPKAEPESKSPEIPEGSQAGGRGAVEAIERRMGELGGVDAPGIETAFDESIPNAELLAARTAVDEEIQQARAAKNFQRYSELASGVSQALNEALRTRGIADQAGVDPRETGNLTEYLERSGRTMADVEALRAKFGGVGASPAVSGVETPAQGGEKPVSKLPAAKTPPSGDGSEVDIGKGYTMRRLEDAQEGEGRSILFHVHQEGSRVAAVRVNVDAAGAAEVDVTSKAGPGSVGASMLRRIRSEIQRQYPEIKTFSGKRVSGAGAQPGRKGVRKVTPVGKKKTEEPAIQEAASREGAAVAEPDTADMTYEQFSKEYRKLFQDMMRYTPNQVGSQVYAERMAELADDHPEWAQRVEDEEARTAAGKILDEAMEDDEPAAAPAEPTYKRANPVPEAKAPATAASDPKPEAVEPEIVSEGESELLRLAQAVRDKLAAGVKLDNPALNQIRRDVFGKLLGNARAAYDAAEAGLFLQIETLFQNKKGELYSSRTPLNMAMIRTVIGLTDRMPTQAVRDESQVELQQFSTPPAEAFVTVWLAGGNRLQGLSVLEPSAGTGSLAVMARLAGADVTVNEIDERRRQILKEIHGFEPMNIDAEQFNNLAPESVNPDVVIMNPPFSATGGRLKAHDTKFGAAHVEQALLRLKPGGRLVAIVGRGMARNRPKLGDWWKKIEGRYNVRANIGIDGRSYGKFGTDFDNQIIVIDHTGPTPAGSTVMAEGLTPDQLFDMQSLQAIAKEAIHERVRKESAPAGEGTIERPVSPGTQEGTESGPATGAGGAGRAGRRTESGPRGTRAGTGPVAGVEQPGRQQPGEATGSGEPGTRARTPEPTQQQETGEGVVGRAGEPGSRRDRPASQPALRLDATEDQGNRLEMEEGSVFARYRVQKARVKGARQHPGRMVESATLGSVEPPDVKYSTEIPVEVIEEGRLSDLQLEAIIYAGQAHSQQLADGSRMGFWIGDGTGVGKGREIWGIILDNLMQGRKRAVHVSLSHQLVADSIRDRDGVGVPMELTHQKEFKQGDALPDKDGVIFTTYSMLRQGWKDKSGPRFDQLAEWLGDDFDGVIAFDEAHAMKNAFGTKQGGGIASESGTLQGQMGLEIQARFPKARVVYVSATGATENRNLAFMSRLGMWGEGAPFRDFVAFLNAMQQGGVAAMEMFSRDMKAIGRMVNRSISMRGPTENETVIYGNVQHSMTEGERRQYNIIADLWAELLQAFDAANVNSNASPGGTQFSQFYSSQQRFFLQLMMSYQLPDLFSSADADLDAGRSIVINVYNTNEGAVERTVRAAQADGIDLDQIDFTPREMLVDLVNRHFPLQQFVDERDPVTGAVVKTLLTDSAGNPVLNRENVARQQQLLEKIADIDFPDNPFDAIVNHFGPSNLAEISGRTRRLEGNKYVRRKIKGVPHKKLNEHETKLFQEGRKRVALITAAATTGISLHADTSAKNQQRRVFYAFQLPWSGDLFLQAMGRVHRSSQTSAPIIRAVTVDVAGQKRLENSISKRLAGLGAIITGERRGFSGGLFRVEDITDDFGKSALSITYSEIISGRHKQNGLDFKTIERMGLVDKDGGLKKSKESDVETFLNRIMALPIEQQNMFFEVFYGHYQKMVARAQEAGSFDFGVEEIKARNLREVSSEIVHTDEASGAKTRIHEVIGEVNVHRIDYGEAKGRATKGFFVNERSGRIYAVRQSETDPSKYVLVNVRDALHYVTGTELRDRHRQAKDDEARRLWEAEYESTPATEEKAFHILSGAIFPVFDKVMGHEGLKQLKVNRITLENGNPVVGLRLAPSDVPQVKQRLGIGSALVDMPSDDILNLITGGAVIELDNGWRLRRARISGEDRIELDLRGQTAAGQELERYGLVGEIHQFKRRWFVDLDAAVPVIDAIRKAHKPIRDVTAEAQGGSGASRGPGGGGGTGTAAQPRETTIEPESRTESVFSISPEAARARSGRRRRGEKPTPIEWDGHPIILTKDDSIRPIEMPELVRLAEELTGNRPTVGAMGGPRGVFKSDIGGGQIRIDFRAFASPQEAAEVLAHEIGHAIDWLPDETLKRGNLVGRLFSLRKFLKQTFGGLKVRDKEIRSELIALSQYWRPFDPKKSGSYTSYRMSSRELYADAVSVLLNSPGTVERYAPTFYGIFLDNLQLKPKVAEAFQGLQDLLRSSEAGEAVIQGRRERLREGFDVAEDIATERERAKEEAKTSNRIRRAIENLRFNFDDKNYAILRRLSESAADDRLPADKNPRYLLEEAALSDAKNYEMVRRVQQEIVEPFVETGIEETEALTLLGEYLFNARIARGDRTQIANPQGITPTAASANLADIRFQITPEQWQQLERSVAAFHELVFEASKRAADAGVYGMKKFRELIEPNKETYAAFQVADYADDRVSAGIKMQRGTFKDVRNPFLTTLLKTATLNRLIAFNLAKRETVAFLKTDFSSEIERSQETRTPEGRKVGFKPNRRPELSGRIELLEDGELAGYDVDPYIGAAFERLDPTMIARFFQGIGRFNRKVFHPLFVAWSVRFQVRNFQRDVKRTWKAGVPIGRLLAEYARNLPAGRRRVLGIDDALIAEMVEAAALDVPWSEGLAASLDDDAYERQLKRLALREESFVKDRGPIRKILMAPFDAIAHFGDIVEVTSKIAGWQTRKRALIEDLSNQFLGELTGFARARTARVLGIQKSEDGYYRWTDATRSRFAKDMVAWVMNAKRPEGYSASTLDRFETFYGDKMAIHKHQMAYEVRNYTGTPNYRRRGPMTYITNGLFMYSNVAVQGIKADIDIATAPKTRSGYWAKTLLVDVTPKLLMAMAGWGVFGDELKEFFAKIGEYEKLHYILIPLGWQGEGEDRKAVYAKIPHDESGRFVGSLIYSLATSPERVSQATDVFGEMGGIFNIGAGHVPGWAPVIQIGWNWLQFTAGKNPTDSFTGRDIIPRTEFEAGGMEALAPMVEWTLNQGGIFRLSSYTRETDTTAEAVIQYAPGLGALFGITNWGDTEREINLQREETREAAQFRLSLPENARELVTQFHRATRQPDDRQTLSERRRLRRLREFNSDYLSLRKQIEEAEERGMDSRADRLRRRLERRADATEAIIGR